MSKNITRRDFLKGTAAGALGLAAMGIAGVPAASAAGTYKAGTYEATAYGNLSYVTVKCTFSEDALTDVEIVSQNETPVLFSQVQEKLIPAIIENQAGGLDAIAGASNSQRPARTRPTMWTSASSAAAVRASWPRLPRANWVPRF